jgi:hypothetical protein
MKEFCSVDNSFLNKYKSQKYQFKLIFKKSKNNYLGLLLAEKRENKKDIFPPPC